MTTWMVFPLLLAVMLSLAVGKSVVELPENS